MNRTFSRMILYLSPIAFLRLIDASTSEIIVQRGGLEFNVAAIFFTSLIGRPLWYLLSTAVTLLCAIAVLLIAEKSTLEFLMRFFEVSPQIKIRLFHVAVLKAVSYGAVLLATAHAPIHNILQLMGGV